MVTVIWGLAFAYELVALLIANRVLRLGLRPIGLRYANALVETSIPTLALIRHPDEQPAYLVAVPVTWGYFIFIILATLRLDFGLCVFTGLVAAVEYLWLAVYFLGQPQTVPTDPSISNPLWEGTKVILLIGGGLLAGWSASRSGRQFATALRPVQDRNRVVSMFGQHVAGRRRAAAAPGRRAERRGPPGLRGVRRHPGVHRIRGASSAEGGGRVPEYAVLGDVRVGQPQHNGIVNKFLGDGFMAVFGAPIADDGASRNAVAAGLEIVDRVKAMSDSGQIEPTVIRIGLHAGEAVTGTVGSTARKEYTVIGDVVNLASRLEQLNKQFGSQLLVSDAALEQLDGQRARAIAHGEVQVKGREQPVQVYQLA